MSEELVVALAQMTSVDHIETNLTQMTTLLEKIFAQGQPRLVCFPENCLYMRLIEGEKIEGFTVDHPALKKLADLAVHYKTYLHLGSIPLYVDKHFYNSSVLLTPQGEVRPTYQKMHLFDIQLEGQNPMRESDVFRHGQHPHLFEVDGWSVGESICYDLRFSELYAGYARKEADLILIPAAFLVKTGEAHWQVLLRARAIESQAYVMAAAQAGVHQTERGGRRQTYGHSTMVDPWGGVQEELSSDTPEVRVITLKRERLESVRRQIPMKFHRRIPVA